MNLAYLYLKGRGVPQDYHEALALWQKADAQGESRATFNIGKMYEDGLGGQKNLEMAKQWYKKAADGGDERARQKLKKMEGGCYITTAVCGSLNKPDDCEELMTLRWYRDKLIAEDQDMGTLIREYYRVAPQVVDKIDRVENAETVYKNLWENWISGIYRNIKQKEYTKAKLEYIAMLEELCNRYQVSFGLGIGPIIERVRSGKN
jgi:hypothetical protein